MRKEKPEEDAPQEEAKRLIMQAFVLAGPEGWESGLLHPIPIRLPEVITKNMDLTNTASTQLVTSVIQDLIMIGLNEIAKLQRRVIPNGSN